MKLKSQLSPNINPVVAFGVHDSNIRLVERLLGIKIHAKGSEVVLEGEENMISVASRVMQKLYVLAQGNTPITHDEIKVITENMLKNGAEAFSAISTEGLTVSRKGNKIKSKTANQALYIRDILHYDLVFGIGPAGTGKTYLAIAAALHSLLTKRVSRIILSRPVVEAGENLGFLPGTLEEKINPYLKPLFDAIAEMLSMEELEFLLSKQIIELAPLAYMRGRTLSNAFVILDEAQNTTSTQMKMFLTRLGEGSKMVVTGDISQIDLPLGKESGLKHAARLFKDLEEIRFMYFEEGDIVRHGLVRKILELYKKEEEEQWKNS